MKFIRTAKPMSYAFSLGHRNVETRGVFIERSKNGSTHDRFFRESVSWTESIRHSNQFYYFI